MNEMSALKLRESPSGRRYLEKLRREKRLDVLQPSDPLFEKVWGGKEKERREMDERQEKEAKEMWARREEEKAWNEKKGYGDRSIQRPDDGGRAEGVDLKP